jgi:hypothetical protein
MRRGRSRQAAVEQLAAQAASACTEFGQGPVDELHSLENRIDKVLD